MGRWRIDDGRWRMEDRRWRIVKMEEGGERRGRMEDSEEERKRGEEGRLVEDEEGDVHGVRAACGGGWAWPRAFRHGARCRGEEWGHHVRISPCYARDAHIDRAPLRAALHAGGEPGGEIHGDMLLEFFWRTFGTSPCPSSHFLLALISLWLPPPFASPR